MAETAPAVGEIVLCGTNQAYVGALIWLKSEATHDRVEVLRSAIGTFNQRQTGSARRIGAALVVTDPLTFTSGELTDKGNAAPRKVRETRAAEVARLFVEPLDSEVLFFPTARSAPATPSPKVVHA